MKQEIIMMEKINLLEKELVTLTERLEIVNKALKELEDLKLEIKGLKIFLARVHPDFKGQFPEIIKKLS
ncbi:MAG: hypothetical protein AB1638_10535 [Nitrospirota bacterium]